MKKHNLMTLINLCLSIQDITDNVFSFILIMKFKFTRGSLFILNAWEKVLKFISMNKCKLMTLIILCLIP